MSGPALAWVLISTVGSACSRSSPSASVETSAATIEARAVPPQSVAAVPGGGAVAGYANRYLPRPERLATRAGLLEHPRPQPVVDLQLGDGWGCANLASDSHWPELQCWVAGHVQVAGGSEPATIEARRVSQPSFTAIAGRDRLCAEVDGGVRCWAPPKFELSETMNSPGQPSGFGDRSDGLRLGLTVGGTFWCRPLEGGRLYCSGDDTFGQLAGGLSTPAGGVLLQSIRLGNWHGCVQTLSHEIYCWGRNDQGQLGYVTNETCRAGGAEVPCSRTPRKVPLGVLGNDVLHSVVVGDFYTCAVAERQAYCWGASRDGFFGRAGACPDELRRAWPTSSGDVPAPHAACSRSPVRIAVPLPPVRVPRFGGGYATEIAEIDRASAGPRGLCLGTSAGDSTCKGAVPQPKRSARAGGSSADSFDVRVSPGDEPAACSFGKDGVSCWGAGYSPSHQLDRPVQVRFEQSANADAPVLDSAPEQGKRWQDDCRIHRPCAGEPQPLPRCAAAQQAVLWSDIAPIATDDQGQHLNVRGRLVVGTTGCTGNELAWLGDPPPEAASTSYCDHRDCGAGIAVADGLDRVSLEGFQCQGDPSRMCCNAPAFGQQVIASGTLEWYENGDWPWVLRQPSLCEVAPSAP